MAELPTKPPAPAAHDRDDDVAERRTIRDYYIILRERLWIALPLAVLAAVAYGYQKLQATPMYAAQATMVFQKRETPVQGQGVIDVGVSSEIELNTHIKTIDSGFIRGKVLESFTDPAEQQILRRAHLKDPGATVANVGLPLGNVTPYSNRGTLLVTIAVQHRDPEAAKLVADRFVKVYHEHLVNLSNGTTEEAVKNLRDARDRLKKESEEAEAALQRYMKEYNLLSLESTTNLVADELRKAAGVQADARRMLAELENKVKQVDDFLAQGRSLLEIPDISANPIVSALRSTVTQLTAERSLLSERYYERHPKMIQLENQIHVTQGDLQRALDTAVAELRVRLSEAQQTVKTADAHFARAEEASHNLNDRSIQYTSLKTQAQSKKASYEEIARRYDNLNVIKNFDKVPLSPLDWASVPNAPYSPDKGAITKTCIGIGVLVFFAVAVGLSFIDDRIKSAWDVESFIGVNLLGIIPDLAAMKDDEKYNLVLDNKQAPGTEAFLSVYSSIKIHSKLDFPKSVLITSTIPGEGKTLISCNVAGSFARHGKRTLLIDCDLRRPMLHRHFKQQNNAGLLPWFESGAAMEGDLATNPALGIIKVGENLFLLCSGGRSKSPTELLENPLFGQLLERLKREFDLVIVDSPPLGAVTDSLLIAERIDEVVYVCRFNRAYRKHIRLYMRALRNGKNEVLGVVLNGLSPRRIEYYSNYRYYRSYKKYYGAQT